MDAADELSIPDAAEDEARAVPAVRRVADLIGAFAGFEGLVSPRRFETAISVAEAAGTVLGEPSLIQVLTLRALAAPPPPAAALAALRAAALSLSGPERAALMRELARLLVGNDAKPAVAKFGPELAAALDVPLPDHLRQESGGIRDALGALADRARKLVRAEPPLLVAARDFAMEFGETELFAAVAQARRADDPSALIRALRLALEAVRGRVGAVARAAEGQAEALSVAQELDAAADQIERVARQRYAAITRRAVLLKRHLREEIDTLVADAAEEFEVDFRRLAEKKRGWFGNLDSTDLNDRIVIKNLERRYLKLARRYQDQLDLLDREVCEFCDEYSRVVDEALRPMVQHEFRAFVPHPALRLRLKTAADRAGTGTLLGGAAGAAASGAAVHAGLLTAGAVIGAAATPVGAAILGAVALAGVWKGFAAPNDRHRRDLRERARLLEDALRQELMANLPRFENAVDAVVDRFRLAAVPDVARPRVEAARIREIAAAHRTIARGVIDAANARVDRLISLMETSGMLHETAS
jgi:HPt (histidine-containing phosphotransfer) domain-containing protein